MVDYGSRPVRDFVILQYYGKIRYPSSQGCCYIRYSVRDVDIMQYYDKKKNMGPCVPPSTNFTNLVWARSTSVRDVIPNNIFKTET